MSENVKNKIVEALIQLSERMSIEKINVSMLVKECGISRSSFYYYYDDIYSVLEDIISNGLGKLINQCIGIEDRERSMVYFVDKCCEIAPMFRQIKGTKYYEQATCMITRLLMKYFRIALYSKNQVFPLNNKDSEFLIEFISAGMTGMMFEKSGEKSIDKTETAQYILRLISGYIEQNRKSVQTHQKSC